MSYRPESAPPRFVVETFSMSLSLDRTFPNCWGVVPCRVVVFTCSRISVVFASPFSARNLLMRSRSLVVLIVVPSCWSSNRQKPIRRFCSRKRAPHFYVPDRRGRPENQLEASSLSPLGSHYCRWRVRALQSRTYSEVYSEGRI